MIIQFSTKKIYPAYPEQDNDILHVACYTCNKNIQDTWSGTGTIVSGGLSIHLPILHYWPLFPPNYGDLQSFLFSSDFCPSFPYSYFYHLLKNIELLLYKLRCNHRKYFQYHQLLYYISHFCFILFKFSQALFKHIFWKYILKIWSFVNLYSSTPFRFYSAFSEYSFLCIKIQSFECISNLLHV